ncbi:zinc finger CCCH domain-containing protein 11A isoform X2 [Thalassophryne amazonica]|nr:zinc finger CCCH domain-containing protein 11A isoform X2 [Thalassophryne amazonica]
MKTETHVTIPSPTHPPVVINPADDDEDEDDQFSEEGEDGKVGSSRKLQAVRNSGPLLCGEMGRPRGSLADRLGHRTIANDVNVDNVPQLKRSLAERLGRVVASGELVVPPHRAVKSIRDRLDLPAEPVTHLQRAGTRDPEQIHIKTLEEIRQEKATESHRQKDAHSPKTHVTKSTKPTRSIKRAITVRDASIGQVKTFSEILQAKSKEHQQQDLVPSPKKSKNTGRAVAQAHSEADTHGPAREAPDVSEVRVKTLEEIRREKAARIQVQHALQAEKRSEERNPRSEERNPRSEERNPRSEERNPSPLLIKKLAAQPGRVMTSKTHKSLSDTSESSVSPCPQTSHAPDVTVKTFEEIMREKRLRKQEMERASSVNKDECPAAADCPPAADVTSDSVKRSTSVWQDEAKTVSQRSPQKRPSSSSSPAPTPAHRARTDPHSPTMEETQTATQKSPDHSTDAKVRPKLNVKPSVMKPAGCERPGQKKRGPQRSAVAAVKPLTSASSGCDQPVQETAANEGQVDLTSNLLTERDQPASVLKHIPSQKPKLSISAAASRETGAVPQSPGLKRPAQLKSSRSSVGGAAAPPVDDFDDLINEFTEGDLEDDLDPDIGEDDLLLELSEMIDS